MKIAISCHSSQGGSGVAATELATALVRNGHDVHLVACERPFRLLTGSGVAFHEVEIPDYPLFRFPPHDLSLANKLAAVTVEHGLDIIHAHYAVPHAVTALLARQIVVPHDVRVVTTLHGTDITLVGSHNSFYQLIRHAITGSDAVTAVSSWLARETADRFSIEAPLVVPNFVNVERFNPAGRAPHPGPDGEFTLVHASNLRPVKRITHIIRTFKEVRANVRARLMILGHGPEEGTARELAAELRISDSVSFNGISSEMPEQLRSAHLYMLLSDYESFGLSALEAMACGTPVVASAAGGLPEVITNEKTGLLCPNEAPALVARRVVDVLKDAKKWNAMSDEAARAAHLRFSAGEIVPQYEAVYERALEGKESTA